MSKNIIQHFKELKVKENNTLRRDNFLSALSMLGATVVSSVISVTGVTLFFHSLISGWVLGGMMIAGIIANISISIGFDMIKEKNINSYKKNIEKEINEVRSSIYSLIDKKIEYKMPMKGISSANALSQLTKMASEVSIQEALGQIYRLEEGKKVNSFFIKKDKNQSRQALDIEGNSEVKSKGTGEKVKNAGQIINNVSCNLLFIKNKISQNSRDTREGLKELGEHLEKSLGLEANLNKINTVINLHMTPDNILDSAQTYFDYARLMTEYGLSILEVAGKYSRVSKEFLIKAVSHSAYRLNDYDIAYLEEYRSNRDAKGSFNFLAKMIPILIGKTITQLAVNPKNEYAMALLAKLLKIEPAFVTKQHSDFFNEMLRLHYYKYSNSIDSLLAISLNKEIERAGFNEADYDFYKGVSPKYRQELASDNVLAPQLKSRLGRKSLGIDLFTNKNNDNRNNKGESSEQNLGDAKVELNNQTGANQEDAQDRRSVKDKESYKDYIFKSLESKSLEHWSKIVQTLNYLEESGSEFKKLSSESQVFIKSFLSKTFIQIKDFDNSLEKMPNFSDKKNAIDKLEELIELTYHKMQELLLENIETKNQEMDSLKMYTAKVMKAGR